MKRKFLSLILALSTILAASAQTASKFEIKIWDGTDNTDSDRGDAILYGYLPENSNGKAVIICPGGGYAGLCMDYEGTDFAEWFNEHGIAGFVLKYRLPRTRYNVPLADAEQATRIVRENALKWKIDPDAIGIMGSSAGGHLASTLATHFGSRNTMPNFQILLYPVITMNQTYTHAGTRSNLLGDAPATSLVSKFSNEKQVKTTTPKAFVVVSAADELVPVYNSLQYTQALINKNIPVSLHIYPGGFHGFGDLERFEDYEIWHNELLYWMENEISAKVYDVESDYIPDHSVTLLNQVSQLSDNCHWVFTGLDFSVAQLLDGSKLTHFHSDATNATPLSSANQYIQMDLLTEQTAIQLYFAGRAYGEYAPGYTTNAGMVNTPNHIVLLASNTPEDEASWTKVSEITSGFPGVCDGGDFYSDPIELENPYRYLRMKVLSAEQSGTFWNISELQVYPCVKQGTSISAVNAEGEQNVYTLDGKMVRENTQNVEGLNSGIYVVGNKKISIK